MSMISKIRPKFKIISAPAPQKYSKNYNNLIEKVKLCKKQGVQIFCFIINLILDRSGAIMASSMVSENHWSCVHFNVEAGDELYADSIGREVPRDFQDTFSNFFQTICKLHEKKIGLY